MEPMLSCNRRASGLLGPKMSDSTELRDFINSDCSNSFVAAFSHVPIRQILLLLANAVLGHPDSKDRLMVAADVPKIIAAGTRSKASIYNNIFGGNLSEGQRDAIPVFNHLDRFRIGY